MRVRVLEADLFLTDCSTRIPFRFGISTLTFAPLCTTRILVETEDGARGEGFSSDLLVPKWFEKNPEASAREDVETLLDSARVAGARLVAAAPGPAGVATVFRHWWPLYQERVGTQTPEASDLLVRGFGVALWERAMMDAVARLAGVSFAKALRTNLFGFEPGVIEPALDGWNVATSLPANPARALHLRHTVGLLDPLDDDDVAADERLGDGLPQTLEEDVRVYGLQYFKIKLAGSLDQDLARLHAIARVLSRAGVTAPKITIDGNEQFGSLADLVTLLETLADSDEGHRLLRGLLCIEQPLARDRTFEPAPNAAMARLDAYAPVIIDEADVDVTAFPRAIALGYRGISVKNCKGVFRALLNRCRCDASNGVLLQSAEDLTNLPVLALQQDLATVAALGLTHVERNGHHYFRGLDHLPPDEAAEATRKHPDLYEHDRLAISGGTLAVASLQCPGYGYDVRIRCDERTPADQWTWPERTPC